MIQHARNTAIFSALTMLSRVSGMLRLMVFAYAIGGRTVLADAYQLAYLIPSTIYEFIVGGLLSAVFIPLLVSEQEKSGKNSRESWQVANLLLGGVGLLLMVASLIALACAPWVIQSLTAMSEEATAEETQRIATHLFRWFTPQILLLGINAVCMAILNSLAVFAVTAAAPIINNIVVIGVFLAYHFGLIDITGLAVGTTLGTASMIAVQLPALIKHGMQIRPSFNLRHPVFRSVTSLGWPIILVSVANLFGWAVRANLLSTVLGAFAIYTMCFQIIMMPYGIFAVSIATVLYPSLSRHAANKDKDKFLEDMAAGFRWTTFILLPISLGLAVLALPVVRLLFEHRGGQFTYTDSLFAGSFLSWYALSILPYALVMFATRVFYSTKDTGTPAVINIAGVVINAGISYFLLKTIGAEGIALAAAVTYTLTTSVSVMIIRGRAGGLGGKVFWMPLVKMAAAGLLMVMVVDAADHLSRPKVVVIERGQRLEIELPESAATGGLSLIHNDADLERVWTALGQAEATVPGIDFSRKSLALVWGPFSKTTSTLNVDGRQDDGRFLLTATVSSRGQGTTGSVAGDLTGRTNPAYALVELASPNAEAVLEIEVAPHDKEPGFGWQTFYQIIHLGWLVTLGAACYFVSAFLFGIPEVTQAIGAVKRRLNRFKGSA